MMTLQLFATLVLGLMCGGANSAWRLAAMALAIQVIAVLFSLAGPVPINNRIAKWTPESLPPDWKEQEHRWDLYPWFRTGGLTVGFAILAGSVGLQ